MRLVKYLAMLAGWEKKGPACSSINGVLISRRLHFLMRIQLHIFRIIHCSLTTFKLTITMNLQLGCIPTDPHPAAPAPNPERQLEDASLKYKRSTNNSHKKFICVVRRLLFQKFSNRQRAAFSDQFSTHKNSRVLFFIILAHVKIRMSQAEASDFGDTFVTAMNRKMKIYNSEINNSTSRNFINFRLEEIADIKFAIKALQLYFRGAVEEAIETIYRKERLTIFKRQQYEAAVQIILELEKKLKSYPPGVLIPRVLDGKSEVEESSPQSQGKNSNKEGDVRVNVNESSDEEWEYSNDHSRRNKKKRGKYRSQKVDPSMKVKFFFNNEQDKPLLPLENSYPIQPNFFPIIYNNKQQYGQESTMSLYPHSSAFTNIFGQDLSFRKAHAFPASFPASFAASFPQPSYSTFSPYCSVMNQPVINHSEGQPATHPIEEAKQAKREVAAQFGYHFAINPKSISHEPKEFNGPAQVKEQYRLRKEFL